MKKKQRHRGSLFDSFLILTTCLCLFYLGTGYFKSREDKARDRMLQAAARIEQPDLTVYQSPINFERLREINPDIVAWLIVPGTEIDYPVAQAADNDKYLTRDFYGKNSKEGTLFLDCDSRRDFQGRHAVIYGHHMKNKRMFTSLGQFKEEEFFSKHREILLYTPEKEWRLRTIAVVYGTADGEKRKTSFQSERELADYIDQMTEVCKFRELPEKPVKQLFSFVTCSYEFQNARTILYAAEEEERSALS